MIKQTHKISVAKLDKILALKEKGLALRDIGKLMGLTGEGVRYLINKYAWTRGKLVKVADSGGNQKIKTNKGEI